MLLWGQGIPGGSGSSAQLSGSGSGSSANKWRMQGQQDGGARSESSSGGSLGGRHAAAGDSSPCSGGKDGRARNGRVLALSRWCRW